MRHKIYHLNDPPKIVHRSTKRILYANRNSQPSNGVPGVQFPVNTMSADYSKNLAQFRELVKNKFEGTLFADGKGRLPEFDSARKLSISPAMQAKLDAQLAKYGAQRQSSRDARDVKLPQQTNTYT